MENEESLVDKKKKKFFVKRWFFWALVVLNWVLGIVVSKDYSSTYIVASFFGSFFVFFVFGLFVWIVLKVVGKIRGK